MIDTLWKKWNMIYDKSKILPDDPKLHFDMHGLLSFELYTRDTSLSTRRG